MRRFTAALRAVKENTRKAEADIVTRAGRDVAFRAASFTPKATASAINSKVKGSGALIGLAIVALNKAPGKGQWKKADLKLKMAAILKARKAGIGALRAGWIPAIHALGGTYRGAKLTRGSASKGSGKRATISSLVSIIRNAVVTMNVKGKKTSAEMISVAVAGLNRAIEFVSSDRENYVRKKLIERELRKSSDK